MQAAKSITDTLLLAVEVICEVDILMLMMKLFANLFNDLSHMVLTSWTHLYLLLLNKVLFYMRIILLLTHELSGHIHLRKRVKVRNFSPVVSRVATVVTVRTLLDFIIVNYV